MLVVKKIAKGNESSKSFVNSMNSYNIKCIKKTVTETFPELLGNCFTFT